MEKQVSLAIMKGQISESAPIIAAFKLEVSDIDEEKMSFTIKFRAKDNELYVLIFQFENYPQHPPLLDFIDEETGVHGLIKSYPKNRDSFFNRHNGQGVICHPMNRKAYKQMGGIHSGDWVNYEGWQQNSYTRGMNNFSALIQAIFSRLNGDEYEGRMV